MTQLASLGSEVKIWSPSFTLKEQFFSPSDEVRDLCWNHDGNLLATTSENHNGVTVRMMGQGKLSTVTNKFHLPASCTCVDFASRRLLGACQDGSLHIMDLQTSKLYKSYTDNKFPISVARWNWNDQNIAVGCLTGQIMVYNVITGQSSSPFKPLSSQSVSQLRYNPYHKSSLASVTEYGISFWDTNTRSLVHAFNTSHQAATTDLAFSPVNDQLMASTGLDKRLVLYDVRGRKSINTIVADYPLTSLDMQDGNMVAVGTSSGIILVFDLRHAGVPVLTFTAHKSSVKRICFSRELMNVSTEYASVGASQPKEYFPSAYPEEVPASVNGSDCNNSNNKNWMTSCALPSFLMDESSSVHMNDTSGGVFGNISNLSIGGNGDATGTPPHFLPRQDKSRSSHSTSHETFSSHLAPNVNYVAFSSPQTDLKCHIEGERLSPKSTLTPHDRSHRISSTETITSSPPLRGLPRSQKVKSPGKKDIAITGHAASPLSTTSASASSPAASLSPSGDVNHVLMTMSRELQDLKLEVKSLIRSQLGQPLGQVQTVGNLPLPGSDREHGGAANTQTFQENYLRQLIHDELEEFADQSRKDYLHLKYEMTKQHMDLWWWLDNRFCEVHHHIQRLYEPPEK